VKNPLETIIDIFKFPMPNSMVNPDIMVSSVVQIRPPGNYDDPWEPANQESVLGNYNDVVNPIMDFEYSETIQDQNHLMDIEDSEIYTEQPSHAISSEVISNQNANTESMVSKVYKIFCFVILSMLNFSEFHVILTTILRWKETLPI
jgi:hypothetical protein